jgi:Recombinase
MKRKLTACPAWLKLSDDRTSFISLPDRAKIVRQIFEASIAGLGGYTIAKLLNAKNVPVFGPSPKWDQSTIHNMLRNRATIGEHQPKQYRNRREYPVGDPIPKYYPAAIEESLFQAAQHARRKNLASGRGRKGRFITNLFAGIPTCFYCGSPVRFHSNGKAKSLICAMVLEGRGCYRMAWSYRNFENSFFDFVARRALDPTTGEKDREMLTKLANHIRALSGPDVYDARMNIAIDIKRFVSSLKLACAGVSPVAAKPNARIRRDGPGRYFELMLQEGSAHIGQPLAI